MRAGTQLHRSLGKMAVAMWIDEVATVETEPFTRGIPAYDRTANAACGEDLFGRWVEERPPARGEQLAVGPPRGWAVEGVAGQAARRPILEAAEGSV